MYATCIRYCIKNGINIKLVVRNIILWNTNMAKQMICTECNYIGVPKKITKGSFIIELILYITFIIPGIIYSVWRLSNTALICPKCGKESLIPLDSPKGIELEKKVSTRVN